MEDFISIPGKILENLYSVNELLESKGIIIKPRDYEKPCVDFRIYFNLEKINLNSLAVKHNINGILFSKYEMILLRDDKEVKVDEIFINGTKKLNSLFTSKEFLKEVFRIIGFDILIKKNIYNNHLMTKEENQSFDNIMKELNYDVKNKYKDFKKIFNNLYFYKNSMFSFIDDENKLISLNKTEYKESTNFLKFLKSVSKKSFELHILNAETILFSETFNCTSENTTLDNRTKFLKDNYIMTANKIFSYFKN